MRKSWLRSSLSILLVLLLYSPPAAWAVGLGATHSAIPETTLSETQKILHALNRLGYGPQPGEVERIRKMGLERWIEQQLQPEVIPDEGVEGRLANLETIHMSTAELLATYPPPQMLRGIERQLTRLGMDRNAIDKLFPEVRAFRERQSRQRRERDRQVAQQGEMQPNEMMAGEPEQRQRRQQQQARKMRRTLRGPQRIVLELSQAKLLRAVYSERQLQEVMTDFWFNHFNVFIGKGADRWLTTSFERDAIRPHVLGNFRDLLGATASHPAMLFYLDNWRSADPKADPDPRALRRVYEQAARKAGLPQGGVLGEMLRQRGVDPVEMQRRLRERRFGGRNGGFNRGGRMGRQGRNPQGRLGQQTRRRPNRAPRPQQQRQRRGLNENYARELLELHTLGVDGGYTQQDIIEVARCFTGWTITPPQLGQQFVYVDGLHDRGEKLVLDHKIRNGGRKDAERVLDILARHPSTAKFISTKLARRFVSDIPPETLVKKMAGTFLETGGDIRAVLRTLFSSEEFWSAEALNAKVKTPLEFVASAARATGVELTTAFSEGRPGAAMRLVQALRQLGQPLYGAQPPTGYKDTAEAWVSTGALLNRMKVAVGLANARGRGARAELPEVVAQVQSTGELVDQLGEWVLGRTPSAETRAALEAELSKLGEGRLAANFASIPRNVREQAARMTLGWLLASPEFQRK